VACGQKLLACPPIREIMTEMELTGQMKQQARESKKKKTDAQRYRYMPIPMSITSLFPLDSRPASSFVVSLLSTSMSQLKRRFSVSLASIYCRA
jgi:hypothetical protein